MATVNTKKLFIPNVSLNRFRRSDDISGIPEDFKKGEAVSDGSCFFDSFRQGLAQQLDIKVTISELREECKNFSQRNPPEWFINAIRNSHDNHGIRSETPDIYAKSILNSNRWGDSDIEGKILCAKYKVKLHVIEKHSSSYIHQLVDGLESKSVDKNKIDYESGDTIHIINEGNGHFAPVLRIDKFHHAGSNSDSPDYDDVITPEEDLMNTIKSSDSEEEKLKKIRKLFASDLKPKVQFQEGDNIPYENKDTPLHVAVRKKELNIIAFLIGQGSSVDIKNGRGRTPLDIAKKINRQDIIERLERSPPGHSGSSSVNDRSVDEPAAKKRKLDSSSSPKRKSLDQGSEYNKRFKQGISIPASANPSWSSNEQHTAGDLKKAIHGNDYQLKLLMLFAYGGNKNEVLFRLATEMDEAEKFDDLVFRYTDAKKVVKYRFLQAKHKQFLNEENKIKVSDLKSDSDGDFSLQKYFISYLKNLEKEEFKDGSLEDFIICTNTDFDFKPTEGEHEKTKKSKELWKSFVQEIDTKDEILNLEGERYRFKREVIPELKPIFEKALKKHKLPSDGIDRIDDFLKKLVFAVKQPSGSDLGQKIKTRISNEFKLINAITYNDFFGFMSNWMQHRKKDKGEIGKGKAHFLTHEDLKTFFDEAKLKIATLVAIGPTLLHRKNIEKLGITFSRVAEEPELSKFLIYTSSEKQVFNFISPYGTILSTIKVDQILRDVSKRKKLYIEDDSHIFTSLEDLLVIHERLMDAFKLNTNNLLIIECKSKTTEEAEINNLHQKLSEVIRSNSAKKIILITQEKEDPLASKFAFNSKLSIEDSTSFSDLTTESQNKLLGKKLILFQGTGEKTSLNQLIRPFPVEIIDVNTFVDLIHDKEINIGSQLTDLGKVKNYYIDRKFYQIEIKTNIETDRDFPDKLVYTKEHFNQLCEKSPDSNIHWLKSESGKLIWQQSQGSVSALRKYIQSGESRMNYYSESDLLDHSVEHKVVVIADTAGMGKSTVLTSLSQAMKDKSSCRWVIRINLIKYTYQLNLINSSILINELKSSQFNKHQAIDFLLNKLLKLNDGLEKKLLENNLGFGSNHGMQVVILLDGFDEITPDYKDIVINLLGALKKTKVERLLVTTRPNMKADLESKLNVLAYDLKPFSKDKDQIEFLAKFWQQKFNQEKISQVDDQKLKIYANELITLLSGSTSGKQTEFTGIPLHISMVAEVFYENKEGKQEKEWQVCKEFLDTTNIPNQKPTLPNQFNIARLYERFVKTKFYDIHFKEKREIDFTKPGIKRTFDRDYKEFIKQQQELALYALLNNEEFTKLSSTNQEKVNGWIQDIKSGDENQGIIDQIINGKPHFTHATFAEYFASFPFAEKMVSDFSGTLKHVNKILPNTSPIFINSIIKQLEDTKRTEVLALLEGKPLINFAAQNGYLNLVKTLLESNHDTWPQSDNLGKTPLHYAAEYGHLYIIEYLLNYNNDILEENILEHGVFKEEKYRDSKLVKYVNKPDNDGKAALYYAAKNNKMVIACDLLLKGADSNQLNEYTRPLVSYVIKQVHGSYADQDHKLRPIEEKLLLQDPSAASTLSSDYELPRLLSYFFVHGRIKVITAILDAISDAEKRRNLLNQNDNSITPLDRVNLSDELSDDDRLKITKYLVDNGSTRTNLIVGHANNEFSYYTKILQAAARDGHITTFKYFINLENRDYYYLHLYQATQNNQFDIIQYLLDNKREDIKHYGDTALHTAVDSGSNLKSIKYLIDSGEDVNAKNNRGESPLFQAIYAGRELNVIKYLIERGADVNMQDNKLKTPLYYAIEKENEGTETGSSDQVDVIKYLLVTCNANIPESVKNQDEFFKNPHKFDLNLIDENGMPRLHNAIQSNDIDWSKFIIRKGGDINLKDQEGKTPLHWASQLQQIEIVELLLQYGAMYNVVDLNGRTPCNPLSNLDSLNKSGEKIIWLLDTLDELFNSENLKEVLDDKLLSGTQQEKNFGPYGTQPTGASYTKNPTIFILNARDNKNNALLHLATDKNDKQALRALLRANQDYLKEKRQGWSPHYRDYQFRSINGVNNDGNMPIHIAVIKGNTNMVRLLLNNGAIFNAKNNAGRTPEELSNEHNIPDTLLQSVNAFFNAVDSGEKQVIEDYINKDRTLEWINIRDKSDKTALHRAASSGKIDIIQLLLKNNADIDSLDVNHCTPLYLAVENDKMEVVKLLLKRGANFNVKNKEGKFSFELIENQTSRLLGSINKLFIDIESDNPEGIINHLKIIDIEKTYNIKIETIINVRDNQGNTLLHYAAKNRYLDIVKFLLQHGAIFNSENKFNHTPKELTSDKNIAGLLSSIDEIFKYTNHIHQRKVDMKIITNVRNDKGMTILHVAVKERNNHIVVALLKAGANIDAEDIYNNKPLYYAQQEYTKNILEKNRELLQAVENKDVNKVKSLIVQGAVVSPSTLHLAVQRSHNKIVKKLLKSVSGNAELADLIKIADDDGNTALHLAAYFGKNAVISTLLTYAKNIDDNWITFKELIEATNEDGKTFIQIASNKDEVKKVLEGFLDQVPPKIKELLLEITKLDKINQQIASPIESHKHQQRSYLSLWKFLSAHFPHSRVSSVSQGLYIPSFESRSIKIQGKCASITRAFSTISNQEVFLKNLATSSVLYERLAQGNQISQREERSIFALSKLLDSFEGQLDSVTSSLPSSLSHTKSYKTLEDLSRYIRQDVTGDFAIHLVTSNHVVAIYRQGGTYSYFDSNVAFVEGLTTLDGLISVVDKSVHLAGYKVEEEGFLVERFDIRKAHDQLTATEREVLTHPIRTERHLLGLTDQKLGAIDWHGHKLTRVMLYDSGAKLHLDGPIPILIHSGMDVSNDHLERSLQSGKLTLDATAYLDSMRGKSESLISAIAQSTEGIPLLGSHNAIKHATAIQSLVLSQTGLNSYALNQLLKSPIDESIKALPYYLETSQSKQWPGRLTNAAGRIQLIRGLHGATVSCDRDRGNIKDCFLDSGEISLSLVSQLIEDGIVKNVPKFIKGFKTIRFGTPILRGGAAIVASPFDIYDMVEATIDLHNCIKYSIECKDAIARISFASAYLASGIIFTAVGATGLGTVVGFAIMMTQGVYSGIRAIEAFEPYKLTTGEKIKLFFHTFALQPVPEDVEYIKARKDILNQITTQIWQKLQNSPEQVVAQFSGLGNLTLEKDIYCGPIRYDGLDTYRSCSHKKVWVPKLSSGYSEDLMELSTMKGTYHDYKHYLARIVPDMPSTNATMVCLPNSKGEYHEYDNGKAIYSHLETVTSYCNNAVMVGDATRMANPHGKKKVVFDLSLVHEGLILGSDKWENDFIIFEGKSTILGGENTRNTFILTSSAFKGTIFGGKNATNLLDISHLSDTLHLHTPSTFNRVDYVKDYLYKNHRPTSSNFYNINQLILSANTTVTGSGDAYMVYVKPKPGHSSLNLTKGVIIFPETSLLHADSFIYDPEKNTLSISKDDFTLAIQSYFDESKPSNRFVLVDQYGSTISPLIDPVKNTTQKVALFSLTTQIDLPYEQVSAKYHDIAKAKEGYQVYGNVQLKHPSDTYMVFGTASSDFIPIHQKTWYVEGKEGVDSYMVSPDHTKLTTRIINNYATDQAIDLLYLPVDEIEARKYEDHLYLTYNATNNHNDFIKLDNYFVNSSYSHLAIINKNKQMVMPWGYQEGVKLLPFYQATKDKYRFEVAASDDEIIVDADLDDVTFYQAGNNRFLVNEQPLVVRFNDQQDITVHFFQSNDTLTSDQLGQVSNLAIHLEDALAHIYSDNVKEYTFGNTTIYHNHGPSPNRVGVLLLKAPTDTILGATQADLLVTQGNTTTTIKDWNDPDHRISSLRFDQEEVRGLDRFNLSALSTMQALVDKASLNSIADQQLSKLDSRAVHDIKYLIAARGIENGISTYTCLGFDSAIEEKAFLSTYRYSKAYHDQSPEALVWLMVKGDGPCFESLVPKELIDALELEKGMGVAQIASFIKKHKKVLETSIMQNDTIVTVEHNRVQRSVEHHTLLPATSSATKPTSWLNTIWETGKKILDKVTDGYNYPSSLEQPIGRLSDVVMPLASGDPASGPVPMAGPLPSKPVVSSAPLGALPISPTTGPTIPDMGDQWVKNTDVNGLLTLIDLAVRKWTGYRPKAAKPESYNLETDITCGIQSSELVDAFMNKVQDKAQDCGIDASTILDNAKLYTQAIKTTREKLAKGELLTIPETLFEQLVQQNIRKIAARSTTAQADQLLDNVRQELPNIQQEFLKQQESLEDKPSKKVFDHTTAKADINLLKQNICSMKPINQIADQTSPVNHTCNTNNTIVQNSLEYNNTSRKCGSL